MPCRSNVFSFLLIQVFFRFFLSDMFDFLPGHVRVVFEKSFVRNTRTVHS